MKDDLANANLFLSFVAIIHFLWGVIVLLTPDVLHITAIHEFTHLFGSQLNVALAMFLVAGCAHIGVFTKLKTTLWGVFLLLPQQAALLLTLWGILVSVASSQYPDGYNQTSLFILADQIPLALICVFHTLAIFSRIIQRV